MARGIYFDATPPRRSVMPSLKREFVLEGSADDEREEEQQRPTKRAIHTRIYSHTAFTHEDESYSDGHTAESEEDDSVECISVGSSSEYEAARTTDEEAPSHLLHSDNDSDSDEDVRYARLLQQQEIALARSYLQDGFLGHELLDAFESEEGSFDMSYESLLELQENLGEVKQRGMEQRAIQALPREPYRRAAMGQDKDGGSCVVCMTEYAEETLVTRLPCRHYFHDGCAGSWLRVRASCPVCRETVREAVREIVCEVDCDLTSVYEADCDLTDVCETNCEYIREANCEDVCETNCEDVREANCEDVREANCEDVREVIDLS